MKNAIASVVKNYSLIGFTNETAVAFGTTIARLVKSIECHFVCFDQVCKKVEHNRRTILKTNLEGVFDAYWP